MDDDGGRRQGQDEMCMCAVLGPMQTHRFTDAAHIHTVN